MKVDDTLPPELAFSIEVVDRPGTLHALTKVILDHQANISHIDIIERREGHIVNYLELQDVPDDDLLIEDILRLDVVNSLSRPEPFSKIFGKRIIVIGGGAQVGQVAVGAISEADRHNIRGERISVDTIPLVGEDALAAAVRAVSRLARARAVVLAGAIMGGEVTRAVKYVREKDIIVISLNMAGTVPDAADLVVTDPVQAGVMAVMAIADTAKFDIRKQAGRRY